MANAVENGYDGGGSGGGGGGAAAGGSGRAPRLPRWTRQEILVLIQGKRVVESWGRGRGSGSGSGSGAGRPAAILEAGHPVEPKWASVSAYCRRHGVDRGPVQCRKRWSNLAGDFKKIKEWERGAARERSGESFWGMRNDVRRERRLPGFFDREVYDILDGAAGPVVEAEEEAEAAGEEEEMKGDGRKGEAAAAAKEDEEAIFDSGQPAAEDGLFSDFEEEKEAAAGDEEEEPADEERRPLPPPPPPPVVVLPISEKKSEPSHRESSDPGMAKDKHPADNPEKESPSQEGHKRRRTSQEEAGDTTLQSQLIEVLEKNSRALTAHLEAQNINCRLDRDQRKDQADSFLSVLGKLADALGKIADKL